MLEYIFVERTLRLTKPAETTPIRAAPQRARIRFGARHLQGRGQVRSTATPYQPYQCAERSGMSVPWSVSSVGMSGSEPLKHRQVLVKPEDPRR